MALITLLKDSLEQGSRKHTKHLFTHNIGGLTDTVDKGCNLLNGWRFYHVKAVGRKEVSCNIADVLPLSHVPTKEILGTLYPLRHVSPLILTRLASIADNKGDDPFKNRRLNNTL
jgi:hypothetical protein